MKREASDHVWEYPGTVDRWIDGDTLVAHVRYAPTLHAHGVHVRLRGVDTPEFNSTDPVERERARRARDLAEAMAAAGSPITLVVYDEKDKYGRLVADVLSRYGASIARAILDAGLVKGGLT